MKVLTLGEAITATTSINLNSDLTPQTRGRDAVLVVISSATFDGTVTFADADIDGSTYVPQFAAVDLTTGEPLLRSVTMADLAQITIASRAAGSVYAYLLVGE